MRLDTVTVANGENMVIDGIATENLSVGNRSVESRIHISSDMSGLIIGVDWLKSQGRTIWDWEGLRIRFGDSN